MPGAEFGLAERLGLPDEIAYLRARHPGPWSGHVLGQVAAHWLAVHDQLRGEGSAMTDAVEMFRQRELDADGFQQVFVPRLNGFLQHLEMHHRIEDAIYFPRFRELDERMVVGFDLLETDHQQIHELLTANVEGARGLLTALSSSGEEAMTAADSYAKQTEGLITMLLRHLADEEDLVVPALIAHGDDGFV